MPELRIPRKLLFCLLTAVLLAGQTEEVRVSSRSYVPGLPPNDPTLVQVGVVVRDTQGHAVPGLKAENFHVLDQGKETPIVGLTPVIRGSGANSKQPQNIAICFDDYGSTAGGLQRAKLIAIRFIQDGIASGDLVAVASTYNKRMLEFTADKAKIQGAIERVQQQATPVFATPQITRPGQMPGSTRNGPAGVLAASDQNLAQSLTAQSVLAVIGGLAAEMARIPGNRTILLLSPGFNGAPERELDQAITQALGAGVVINVVDAKSSLTEAAASAEPISVIPAASYGATPDSFGIEASIADLAHGTGGLFFHNIGGPMSKGYRELGVVPEMTYVLSVRPERGDQKYHRLKVQLGSAGASSSAFVVAARSGYFPPKGATESSDLQLPAMRARLDQQVAALTAATGFPASVGIQYNKLANGNTGVRVAMHVDIKPLQFGNLNDRRTQRLTLVAAILDSNGKVLSAKEGLMELALTEAKYNSMLESGLNLMLNLEAASGTYRLSTVTQEAQGKMAGTLNAIQVP